MSLALGLALLALHVAAGWGPARRLLPEERGLGRWAGALALGSALVGLVQVALSVAGWPVSAVGVVVIAALSLGVDALVQRRARTVAAAPHDTHDTHGDAASPVPSERLPRWLLALLLAVCVFSTAVAVGSPFQGDGAKFWGARGKELAAEPASVAGALHDPERLAFHRSYPLLLPALMAPAFALSPQDASTGPKLVLHGLTLALLVLATLWLGRRGATGQLLAALLLAMPTFTALDVRESAVVGGYADGADALFLLLLVHAVSRLRRGGGAAGAGGAGVAVGAWGLALLSGGALLGTKLEGGVELLILAAAWLLCGPRRARLVPVLAGAALLAAPGFWLRVHVAADPPGVQLALLWEEPARWVSVLVGLARVPLDVSVLGLLPLALLVLAARARAALPGGAPRDGPWPLSFGATLVLGLVAFLALVYATTSMQVDRHVLTSAHRLVLHWMPAFCLLAAQAASARERLSRRAS